MINLLLAFYPIISSSHPLDQFVSPYNISNNANTRSIYSQNQKKNHYKNAGPIIIPSQNNNAPLTYIDIEDQIFISMDIEIYNFSNTNYTNIFLIGSYNNQQPSIWIPPLKETNHGINVSFYNGTMNMIFNIGGPLQTNVTYHIVISYDLNTLRVRANDDLKICAVDICSHDYLGQLLFKHNQSVYIGGNQPLHTNYVSSYVHVTNLIIDKISSNHKGIPMWPLPTWLSILIKILLSISPLHIMFHRRNLNKCTQSTVLALHFTFLLV